MRLPLSTGFCQVHRQRKKDSPGTPEFLCRGEQAGLLNTELRSHWVVRERKRPLLQKQDEIAGLFTSMEDSLNDLQDCPMSYEEREMGFPKDGP